MTPLARLAAPVPSRGANAAAALARFAAAQALFSPGASGARRPRCFSSPAAAAAAAPSFSGPPSVIILGGLNMKEKALQRVAKTLYPGLRAATYTHTLNQIVNVNYKFPANTDRLAAALAGAGPGGAILHIFSGAAFFSVLALRDWAASPAPAASPARHLRGVVLDSIPFDRVERQLMVAARVPRPLQGVAARLAASVLVSRAFGATVALTDAYNVAQAQPRTFAAARRVLLAHSADDDVVPVGQFRRFAAALAARRGDGWHPAGAGAPPPGAVELTVFEGVGRHAAMVLDDEARYTRCVKQWAAAV